VYAVRTAGSHASEDNAMLILSSSAGWQAALALSWQAPAGQCPELIATGTRGAIKIWPENASVEFYPLEPRLPTPGIDRLRPSWLQEWFQSPETQRRRFKLPRQDRMGYQAELRQFLTASDKGTPDVTSAVEARRDLEVALAARASLASGIPVECAFE